MLRQAQHEGLTLSLSKGEARVGIQGKAAFKPRVTMRFDIAVALREDLPVWQKVNVAAFTVSGIAGTAENVIGDDYKDASGNRYLPMSRQPVLVFSGTAEQLRTVYRRAMDRGLRFAVFTEDLLGTNNDIDNRAAVKAVRSEDLRLVGMAFHDDRKVIDKVLKGLSLHG